MTQTKSKAVNRRKPGKLAPIARWRFYGVGVVLCAMTGVAAWHVASLQVLPGKDKGYEFLQVQGQARTLRTESISAYRGVITDRHGEPLAVSSPVQSIWANPQILNESPQSLSALAAALRVDREAIAAKLKRYRDKEFVYLKRHLPPQRAEQVLALKTPGVFAEREYRRFYPAGEVAAHVVGFTDIDDRGQEGMELAFDDWLTGTDGAKQVLKDLKGRVVKDVQLLRAAQSGKDLRLSIDLRLQYLAYRELKTAVKEHRAKSGSVVVLDTQTGEILAMANQPSYNPNDRSRIRAVALRNRAITDQFEPGSTMKPITVMAALETGRYLPHTPVDTSPGYVRVGKKTLLDPINYGVIDVTKILTKSSQVGLTKLALDMEPEAIRDMYFRLGLGQDTGSGFPGESVGVLPNHSRWQPIVQANFAFGYGMSATVLQLAQAYSVIANDGLKRPISLLKVDDRPTGESVVEPRYTRQLIDMLKTVTEKGGTATRASLANYEVAGKTGTVHKVSAQGGYEDDSYLALFAGIAPAEHPRIVTVVMINEPSAGKYFGGEVAAPVFAKVASGALRLMQVPPRNVASAGKNRPAKVAQGQQSNIAKQDIPVT